MCKCFTNIPTNFSETSNLKEKIQGTSVFSMNYYHSSNTVVYLQVSSISQGAKGQSGQQQQVRSSHHPTWF